MIRYVIICFFIFSYSLKAQGKITLVDSTFSDFYIDESTPLPFSPVTSVDFGIPDSARVIIEVHKILRTSDSSQIINTIPVSRILDKILSKGKYQVSWDGKDFNGIILNKEDRFIYYLSIYRKVKTLDGFGYIKIEAKSKITKPNY